MRLLRKGKISAVWVIVALASGLPSARAGWETVGSAFFTGPSGRYSLAFDNGVLYFAFSDFNFGSRTTVMKYDGGDWDTVGSAGFSSNSAIFISLAINNGVPYVAFQDDYNNDAKATVMKFNGANWENVGAAQFSVGQADYISLAFNSGIPYVVYKDWGLNNKAVLMKFNGANWEAVGGGAGFTADEAHFTSLAFHDDLPYVAFEDMSNGGKASLMKFNGTAWEYVGLAGFSDGDSGRTSLAFDGDTPYVAFRDVSRALKATVMKFNGVVWENVGLPGFSAGEVYYLSLAIDNGVPFVVYQDEGTGWKSSLMKFNGAVWEYVGAAGFAGGNCYDEAIAFYDGMPYVAFSDWTHGQKASVMRFAPEPPSSQANSLIFSNVLSDRMTIGWTRGDGEACAVFMKAGTSGSAAPEDHEAYSSNTAFGSGGEIGSTDWYCVYNGVGTSVTVNGLSSGTTYRVMACEHNGTASGLHYLTNTAANNPYGQITIPSAPVASAASGIATAEFSANWGSVSGATGYRLDVAADNGFASFVGGYQDRDVGNVLSFDVNANLAEGTDYYYRVRAYHGGGIGDDSNVIHVITDVEAVESQMPELSVSVTSDTDASVFVGDEVSFVVTVSNVGDGAATEMEIRFVVPGNLEYVSATLEGDPAGDPMILDVSMDGDARVIRLSDLQSGERIQIEIRFDARVSGSVSMDATATCRDCAAQVAGQNEGELVVADEYYVIRWEKQQSCGILGIFPFLGLVGLLTLWSYPCYRLRRIRRSRP